MILSVRTPVLLSFVLNLCAAQVLAADRSVCPDRDYSYPAIKVSQTWLGDSNCTISVLPNTSSLEFREYLFRENGQFTVFVSTFGPEWKSTGSRIFFLFPRKSPISFDASPSDQVTVTASNGSQVRFLKTEARIASFSGANISEDLGINLTNYGGVEFRIFNGILLDTGWDIFEPSYTHPDRGSLFRDSMGHYCGVINREIFDYATAVPRLKFKTDLELSEFLARACPGLETSPLRVFGS